MKKYYGRDMGSSSLNIFKQQRNKSSLENSNYGLNSPGNPLSHSMTKKLDKVQIMTEKAE